MVDGGTGVVVHRLCTSNVDLISDTAVSVIGDSSHSDANFGGGYCLRNIFGGKTVRLGNIKVSFLVAL